MYTFLLRQVHLSYTLWQKCFHQLLKNKETQQIALKLINKSFNTYESNHVDAVNNQNFNSSLFKKNFEYKNYWLLTIFNLIILLTLLTHAYIFLWCDFHDFFKLNANFKSALSERFQILELDFLFCQKE